jgi:hypothetical protein
MPYLLKNIIIVFARLKVRLMDNVNSKIYGERDRPA